jgi:PST family polysaccharide transporter
MALTSAACVPVSHILVRNHLGETLGWDAAGYWEAMGRLSAAYLMLVTTTLSVYFLPKLSELDNFIEIRKEILRGYKIIMPVAAACGFVIYILRDLIVRVLFTEKFSEMEALFAWQMVGDALRIGSWILAFLMLGKAMVKAYIVSEIVFSALFYILVVMLVRELHLQGVVVAYAINYFLYWIALALIVSRFFMVGRRAS